MIDFRVPEWLIYLAIVLNFVLLCICALFQDWLGVFFCVLCIACFIITYRINKRERNEKTKKE
jgi:hypothetical protein